ncbi:hypothetical protein EDC94DRAFT_693397 [Helicostylum pulchrum]|nr:hypothetical protein EDC94DRAFT_693397 [Helicostylum pulchrum]
MNPSENNSNDHAESSYPATSPKQQRIYNIRNAAIEAEVAEEVRLMFKDEGATRCPVLVMMITGGTSNQEQQRMLYSGLIRHRNVQTCAFGAVGMYLFHRFHVKGEAFPDFALNEN